MGPTRKQGEGSVSLGTRFWPILITEEEKPLDICGAAQGSLGAFRLFGQDTECRQRAIMFPRIIYRLLHQYSSVGQLTTVLSCVSVLNNFEDDSASLNVYYFICSTACTVV